MAMEGIGGKPLAGGVENQAEFKQEAQNLVRALNRLIRAMEPDKVEPKLSMASNTAMSGFSGKSIHERQISHASSEMVQQLSSQVDQLEKMLSTGEQSVSESSQFMSGYERTDETRMSSQTSFYDEGLHDLHGDDRESPPISPVQAGSPTSEFGIGEEEYDEEDYEIDTEIGEDIELPVDVDDKDIELEDDVSGVGEDIEDIDEDTRDEIVVDDREEAVVETEEDTEAIQKTETEKTGEQSDDVKEMAATSAPEKSLWAKAKTAVKGFFQAIKDFLKGKNNHPIPEGVINVAKNSSSPELKQMADNMEERNTVVADLATFRQAKRFENSHKETLSYMEQDQIPGRKSMKLTAPSGKTYKFDDVRTNKEQFQQMKADFEADTDYQSYLKAKDELPEETTFQSHVDDLKEQLHQLNSEIGAKAEAFAQAKQEQLESAENQNEDLVIQKKSLNDQIETIESEIESIRTSNQEVKTGQKNFKELKNKTGRLAQLNKSRIALEEKEEKLMKKSLSGAEKDAEAMRDVLLRELGGRRMKDVSTFG
ncbi:Chromosome partition protein Smc [invertebrate metagenome]|uniref:Chromosome partition protein Smc n=1 Tax=invertebrate metagenome TaxID=1711999 RepID=A0A2H9TCK4_9ZZZZ